MISPIFGDTWCNHSNKLFYAKPSSLHFLSESWALVGNIFMLFSLLATTIIIFMCFCPCQSGLLLKQPVQKSCNQISCWCWNISRQSTSIIRICSIWFLSHKSCCGILLCLIWLAEDLFPNTEMSNPISQTVTKA